MKAPCILKSNRAAEIAVSGSPLVYSRVIFSIKQVQLVTVHDHGRGNPTRGFSVLF